MFISPHNRNRVLERRNEFTLATGGIPLPAWAAAERLAAAWRRRRLAGFPGGRRGSGAGLRFVAGGLESECLPAEVIHGK